MSVSRPPRLTPPVQRWKAFHAALVAPGSNERPNLDLADLEQVPDTLQFHGRKLEGVELTQDTPELDLAPLTVPDGYKFRHNLAWLFAEVHSDTDRAWALSFGANWFAAWWCNGERVADTYRPQGNAQEPRAIDHDLVLPLRKGTNLIAVEVLSGSGGFALLCADAHGRLTEVRAAAEKAQAQARRARREAIRGPAVVEVDATQPMGPLTRPERHPSISLAMADETTVQAWVREVGRPTIARVFGAIRPGYLEDTPGHRADEHDAVSERGQSTRLRRLADACEEMMTPLPMRAARRLIDAEISEADYLERLTRALRELRVTALNCVWIEVFNESEVGDQAVGDDDYFYLYTLACRAATRVDREYASLPALKIGGPSPCQFNRSRIKGLIDRVAASSDPAVRLDFLAWHQYLFRREDQPAEVSIESEEARRWLREAGLRDDLTIHITESGVFPTNRGTEEYDKDLITQAAGVLTLHYYYQNQRRVFPYQWTWFHANPRKNQFIPSLHLLDTARQGRSQPGDPIRVAMRPHCDDRVDRFTPFGHAARLQAMLPGTRVHADATPRESQGLGMYALAAADDDRLAILVWNYQFTHYDQPEDYRVNLRIRLPEAWSEHTKLTHWPIGLRHAHYLTADETLTPAQTRTLPVSEHRIEWAFDLPQNEISLISIERSHHKWKLS